MRPGGGPLRNAIATEEVTRRKLVEVLTLRSSRSPVLSPDDALAVVGAGWVLPVDRYLMLLSDLWAERNELSPIEGRRVLLAGSTQSRPDLYHALSKADLLVVGELHDWGERIAWASWDRLIPPVDAVLARHRATPASAARSGTDRRVAEIVARARALQVELVIVAQRRGDTGHRWDRRPLALALAGHGIGLASLPVPPWDQWDPGAMHDAIVASVARVRSRATR